MNSNLYYDDKLNKWVYKKKFRNYITDEIYEKVTYGDTQEEII